MTTTIHISGAFWGMGDGIYQRPYVKKIAAQADLVFLVTPWPQLYHDLPNLRFLDPIEDRPDLAGWTHFRENIDACGTTWYRRADVPSNARVVHWGNTHGPTISRCVTKDVTLTDTELGDIRFPLRPEWLAKAQAFLDTLPRPRILLHSPVNGPGVVLARDPHPNLYQRLLAGRRGQIGWFDVARHDPGHAEPIVNLDIPLYPCRGSDVTTLWALAAGCDGIATYDCQMLWLALAFKKPLLLLQGGKCGSEWLIDPSLRYPEIVELGPDVLCRCYKDVHDCDKTITDSKVTQQVETFLEVVGRAVAAVR